MELLNTVSHMDIFDLCDCLDDDSIDMILADLPYGITACEWDTVIPLDDMWECFKRVIKPRGAVVLTASGKFTYQLVMSNFEWFKYEWVWDKVAVNNPMLAYKQPMQSHEIILVFGEGAIDYYPVKRKGVKWHRGGKRLHTTGTMGATNLINNGDDMTPLKMPKSILTVSSANKTNNQHPTQKPVALFEYLIRTYTQPGNVVFDPVVGSGTTAIAARNTGRNYIVGDSSAEYVQVARDRLAQPYTMPMFTETPTEPKPEQERLL